MEKLSLVLWQERELLQTLLYRLEVEQMLLAQGRTSWLMRAAREVEEVLQSLRESEVLRAVAAGEAAQACGLDPDAPLRRIAAASDEPWRTLLLEHWESFTTTVAQIAEMAETNRHLLTSGYRSARETLLSIGGTVPESYAPDGTAVTANRVSQLVDRSI